MDPITAWALALKAVAEMITEIVKGQPIEVKQKMWERYDAVQERIFQFLHIKDDHAG